MDIPKPWAMVTMDTMYLMMQLIRNWLWNARVDQFCQILIVSQNQIPSSWQQFSPDASLIKHFPTRLHAHTHVHNCVGICFDYFSQGVCERRSPDVRSDCVSLQYTKFGRLSWLHHTPGIGGVLTHSLGICVGTTAQCGCVDTISTVPIEARRGVECLTPSC